MAESCKRRTVWTWVFLVAILVLAIIVLAIYFAVDRPKSQFLVAKDVLHIGTNIIFGAMAFSYFLSYRNAYKSCKSSVSKQA